MARCVAAALCLLGLAACTNNPYPDSDERMKVLYQPLSEPPRTLDPAVSYTASEHLITGVVYATLLDYHYLARPYRLIPGLAREVPQRARACGRARRLPLPSAQPGVLLPGRSRVRARGSGRRDARGRRAPTSPSS